MGNPDDDDYILDSLQQSIQWDPLDGSAVNGTNSSNNSNNNNHDGLALDAPFHVHEDMDDHDSHHVHETHHHHHKPRSMLRKRTDLAAYVGEFFFSF